MARAIFGTSPKNAKKCKYLKFSKVTFKIDILFFSHKNIPHGLLRRSSIPFPLKISQSH